MASAGAGVFLTPLKKKWPTMPLVSSRTCFAMIVSRLSSGENKKALCAAKRLKGLHPVFLALGLPGLIVSRRQAAFSIDGRSSGLLARRAAFPPRLAARQWPFLCPKRVPQAESALRRGYSGGTASDLHGIPCLAFRHRLEG
jgi:hypothetical protein